MRPNAPIFAVLALAAISLAPMTVHALPLLKKHAPKSTHGKLSPEARRGLKEHKAHMAEARKAHKHNTAFEQSSSHAATSHSSLASATPALQAGSHSYAADIATVDRVHAFVESQHQGSASSTVKGSVNERAAARLTQSSRHQTAHLATTSEPTPAHESRAARRRRRRATLGQAIAATPAPKANAPQRATSADFLASAHLAASAKAIPEVAAATGVSQSAESADIHSNRPDAAHQAALAATLAPAQVAADQAPITTVDAMVPDPVAFHTQYNKRGRLIMPAPLKGSHEILLRQNQVADSEGLDRIRDDSDLDRMRAEHLLVAIPTGNGLHVDDRLPTNRRYCRPWTALFLNQLGREYYARFQKPLQVNSAVRTVEFQHHLIHVNGNAAPADGDTASPHLTGQAVDLAKHGLSMTEIAWLRGYLLPLVQQGKVDVEEEFQQSCFHISVYEKFLPHEPTMRRSIAENHRSGTAVLATSLP